jgi:hypothetical protein
MIYLLNCDKLKFFKTFDSLESVTNYLIHINNTKFNGERFSLFGRGQREVWDGEESVWIDDVYYTDSAVLRKGKPNEDFTFFIRCIDSEGNPVELD